MAAPGELGPPSLVDGENSTDDRYGARFAGYLRTAPTSLPCAIEAKNVPRWLVVELPAHIPFRGTFRVLSRLSRKWHPVGGVGQSGGTAMTGRVITTEFVLPTALAVVLAMSLSIGAIYLTEHYLGPAIDLLF